MFPTPLLPEKSELTRDELQPSQTVTLHSTQYEPFIHFTEAADPLTSTQATAIDLYQRGFNVVPLKRHEKKAYILEPYWTARLHHCDATCHHKGRHDIAELFTRNNIGVIAGRTSGNLLAIDCDSQEAFTKIGQELTAHSLPFWAITGLKGGAYLLRVVEGEAANMPKRKSQFKDVEVWGNRHLVVMPPSIHPSGLVYQWATPEPRLYLPPHETLPAVSIAALDWLGITLEKTSREWEEPELYGLPEWASVLTLQSRRTFADTPQAGWRNDAIFSMACDMKANGIDYHDAEQYILELADRAGTPRQEATATLKSAYKKERKTAREFHGGDKPTGKEWQRAQALAESFDWKGTFGRTALKRRAVYLACIERAKLDGRLHWRATAREVAELANVNKETANVCMQDLEHAGLVRRVNSGKHAGLFRFFGLSQFRTLHLPVVSTVRNLDTPRTQAEQDVFRKLGLVSWHVWRYLLTHSARNAGDVARATGLPRSSVYKALLLLTHPNVRLVSRSTAEGGLYYGEAETDDSLALKAAFWNDGTSPSRARKESHRLEREVRVNYLTRKAIERLQTEG